MNQFKKKETSKAEGVRPKANKGKAVAYVVDVFNGNFLTRDGAIASIPFVFFITFVCLCYIGNGYYAEDTVRAINTVGAELKELKTEYIITITDLMFNSKQSQVAKALELQGVRESVVPPKKIVVYKE